MFVSLPQMMDGTNNKKPCAFLEIPPELRNTIYAMTLIFEEPIEIKTHRNGQSPGGIEPALLAINRQIRVEALPVFYGMNIFTTVEQVDRAYNVHKIPSKLFQLGHERAGMIKTLRIARFTGRAGWVYTTEQLVRALHSLHYFGDGLQIDKDALLVGVGTGDALVWKKLNGLKGLRRVEVEALERLWAMARKQE